VAYEQMGQGDKAVADVAHVIESNPKSAKTWKRGGWAYFEMGRKDEAIAAYKEAIRLQPGYVDAHYNLAWELSQKGKLDEAIAEWKEAIRLNPVEVDAYSRLVDVLANGADSKLRDAAEALKMARKAVELAPRESGNWQRLGWALYRTGAWKDSIEAFHKSMALQEDPRGGDSGQWFGLAVAHWQLGNKEEARKWHDQAVQWMEKNGPQDASFRGFRAEAEKLLELKK
jgi:tetratricopeptide (TPR) repeat protein